MKFITNEQLKRELQRQKNRAKSREEIREQGLERGKLIREIRKRRLENKYPRLVASIKRTGTIGKRFGKGVMKLSRNLSEAEKKGRKKKMSIEDVANTIP